MDQGSSTFVLSRAGTHVHAIGSLRQLPADALAELETRVQEFFRAVPAGDGPSVLVGAFPFDPRRPGCLYQPADFTRGQGQGPLAPRGRDDDSLHWCVTDIAAVPSAAEYSEMVARALRLINGGAVTKVVLSRSVDVETSAPVDGVAIARRLARDPDVTTFLTTLAGGNEQRMLLGATPELLVARRGNRVISHPLAGSAARIGNDADDRDAADALLKSDKDQREHQLVVESILDLLAPHCETLAAPLGATLQSTRTMWHLGTRIEATLKADAPSAAGLAALLHPTPAVGGSPPAAALDAIRALESRDRGYYAGAIGWVDRDGDGEWHVTLRCAEIEGRSLRLDAGAGIVAGSDPHAEVAETAAKFRAMLTALDIQYPADARHMAEMAL